MIKRMRWEDDYQKLLVCSIGGIILLKFILMGMFSSDYQDKMFIPFVSCFVDRHMNPYEYYYHNQILSSFPYAPLMLLIESAAGWLLSVLHPESIFLRNFLFKLPLLVFDCIGFVFIWKMSRVRVKYILVLYFLSPISLYATYIHGQLDIIPTVLFLGSLYYLIYEKANRSLVGFSVFLAMALAAKLHILAAVPIVFMYLYKKRGMIAALFCGLLTAVGFCAFLIPFWGQGLIWSVFFNREQNVLSQVFLDYGAVKLILPILAVVLIYLKVFELQHMNGQLLTCLTGVLFAIFLVCVPPMPGWFVWIITFVTLYFQSVNENKYKMLIIYLFFNATYIFYFVFCHQTEFVDVYILGKSMQMLKIGNGTVCSVAFTVMAGSLIILVAEMYRSGVASNSFYKRRNLPFTIGIAGDSGTGKSELLEQIENLLGGRKFIQYIEGDGDHRWQRGCLEWEQYTHLDPKANYLYRQARDIATLREGSMVRRVDYDHKTGKFTELKRIVPKQYIVLCGLHALYLPQMRAALDLKIYMNTDETLRRFWKIQRDTGKRGYTDQEIVRQIDKRIPDAVKYIYPQNEFADLSIRYFDHTLTDCCDLDHQICMSVELSINIAMDMEPVINDLLDAGVLIHHTYCDDLKHQTVTVDGLSLQDRQIDFQAIAEDSIPQLTELFYHKIEWADGMNGVVQLFILVMICSKMRGDC